MAASGKSGNPDPHNQGINAEVSVSSGPTPPGNQHAMVAGAGSEAVSPLPNVQSVAIKLAVHEPQPFSVYLAPNASIRLISVKVQICDGDTNVSDAEVLATDCDVEAGRTTVFPLTDEQLEKLLPRLQVGDRVEVDVVFSAPAGVALKIGIIGKGHHSKLGEIFEHLTQSA